MTAPGRRLLLSAGIAVVYQLPGACSVLNLPAAQ